MELERKRRLGEVEQDEIKVVTQRRASIKQADILMEKERKRRVNPRAEWTSTVVFALSGLALAALLALTFEEQARALLLPPPPPPPPPSIGKFLGLF